MNKERRKQIAALIEDAQKLAGQVSDLISGIESVRDDEQEVLDNSPESFQNGERGEVMQAAIDALENAISEAEGFDFDAIISSLDEATA